MRGLIAEDSGLVRGHECIPRLQVSRKGVAPLRSNVKLLDDAARRRSRLGARPHGRHHGRPHARLHGAARSVLVRGHGVRAGERRSAAREGVPARGAGAAQRRTHRHGNAGPGADPGRRSPSDGPLGGGGGLRRSHGHRPKLRVPRADGEPERRRRRAPSGTLPGAGGRARRAGGRSAGGAGLGEAKARVGLHRGHRRERGDGGGGWGGVAHDPREDEGPRLPAARLLARHWARPDSTRHSGGGERGHLDAGRLPAVRGGRRSAATS